MKVDLETQEKKEEEEAPGEGQEMLEGENEEGQEIRDVAPVIEKPKEYIPFLEEHYKDRLSHPDFQTMKELEDLALSMQKENLKVIVICSGILYGKGEILLHKFLKVFDILTFYLKTYKFYKAAWLQDPVELPYLNEGSNKIPMIHITDLARFIVKIAESPPESSYVLALDNAKFKTQRGIIEAISKGIGSGQIMSVESHEIIDPEFQEILKIDLDMTPSKLLIDEENPPDFEWVCQV